ncbi:D-beta-hydroxybutyrate dehydrogenase, mitochondrial [Microplitis demolitor]|uniref:D-beta-hydroxybutyrate dehydrogenase, mitochondrial n=1 Tax=Microplitis demolitor TaxID=69319 RepID=UPI0004CD95C9|nr:D-beta-hydroxybutyrate dehydrogenase, mitochondrial [Microplitis demolitor]
MPAKKVIEEPDDSQTWELLERCLLPVAFSHAVAVIISTILNTLGISQTSSFVLFLLFLSLSVGFTLFYHNLKVTAAGKAVLVTGCDSRVGCALAKKLDELGFTVFAGFTNKTDNEEKVDKLKKDTSGRLHPLQLDITNEHDIHSAFLYVNENLPDGAPGLWALIHANAWITLGECEWVPLSVVRKSVDINFMSVARLTQVFLPLIRRCKGRIILVSSILARIPSPIRGIQCANGAALEAWGSCLRLEMRRWGVDVVIVEAGEYVAGNSWLKDNSALLNQARDMWVQLEPQTRKEYGEELFQKEMLSLEKYTKGPEADLTRVMRALVDGTTKTFPLKRYTPVTRKERLQAFLSDHIPKSIYDIIYTD